MRIGILSDIHEAVAEPQTALQLFESIGVDQVLCLGDIFDTGRRLAETVDLLRTVDPIGVWGNHDLGFCIGDPCEPLLRFDASTRDFFRRLQPSLQIGEFYFSHGLPHWDPCDPVEYYIGDPPHNPAAVAQTFDECSGQVFFTGHFHEWFVSSEAGQISFDAAQPFEFAAGNRYLMVIHAVLNGWCAVLDTETRVLTPHPIECAHQTPQRD